MRPYTHGGWAHRQRASTTFLTRKKLSQFLLVLLMGFELRVFGSRATPSSPPTPPKKKNGGGGGVCEGMRWMMEKWVADRGEGRRSRDEEVEKKIKTNTSLGVPLFIHVYKLTQEQPGISPEKNLQLVHN